jgi:putative FmdB family regulatory protein
MPTYRYRCAKCGDEMEIWQSFEEKPKTRHAGGCGGKLQKVMSPAGIVLKGSGFYKTDNRSSKSGSKGGSNGAGKESSGSESKSSESPPSKSDSTSSSGKKETASSGTSGSGTSSS